MGTAPDVRVRLSAEGEKQVLDAFRKVSRQAEQTGKRGSRGLRALGNAARSLTRLLPALGFAAAIAGATLLARRTLAAADNVAKLSQQTGVSVETLSTYAHGAELAGTNLEQLAKGLGRFARIISDADRGLATAVRPFQDLNIEFRKADGSLRPLDDTLGDVAEAFAGMEDGTKKAALAQELFGGAGVKLIPFLNQGRAGLARVKEEAEALGLVLDAKTAAAAEQVNDNFTRLARVATGVANTILVKVGPTLARLTDRLVDFVRNSDLVDDLGTAFSFLFRVLISGGQLAASTLRLIGVNFKTLGTAAILVTRGDFGAAIDALKEGFREAKEIGTDTLTGLADTWRDTTGEIESSARRRSDTVDTSGEKEKSVAEQIIARLEDQIATYGLAGVALDLYRAKQAGATEEELQIIAARSRELAVTKQLDQEIETLSANLDHLKLTTEGLSPTFEAYANSLLLTAEAGAAAGGSAEQLAANLEKVEIQGDTTAEVGQRLRSGFSSIFEDALRGGKNFQQLLVSLLQDLASLILQALLLRSLGSIFGGFLGFSGGGLVQGGQAPGAAAGGLIRGPGGPTSDSIPVRVSPGEFIIRTAVVQQPGVLPALQALNAGELEAINRDIRLFSRMRPRSMPSLKGFAEGGLVTGSSFGTQINIDARGGRGDTEAQVRRALAELEERTVGRTIQAIAERQLRSP